MSPKRLHSLMFKSAEIQYEIEREYARPRPDTFRLLKLKKLRLSIKDHLLRLMRKATGKHRKAKATLSHA
jgi:uncharacterized protein YdcH (DUF465 family)